VNEATLEKIVAALPDKPQTPPLKPRRLLVFCRTDRFVHGSIPAWNRMLELLGEKTGAFQATVSQSYDDLTPGRLKEFDAVFFNNTCRMMIPEAHRAALLEFVAGGKGFAGNHGSGDNWQDWREGTDMLGAMFNTHPFHRIHVKIDDPRSPLTATFGGKSFPFTDEIYAFTAPYSREKLRVLLSIDYPNSPEVQREVQKSLDRSGGKPTVFVRADEDYAISWIRPWGKGRFFYCSFGHEEHVTWNPAIVRYNLAGIQYALGDLEADDAPVK
jgi:type 1 glutamine amidotransferase